MINMTKNTKKLIEDENAKWLSQYRERIERRDRTLKHAAVFAIFFTLTTAIYIFAMLQPNGLDSFGAMPDGRVHDVVFFEPIGCPLI